MRFQTSITVFAIVFGGVLRAGYCEEPYAYYCQNYIGNRYLDQMFIGENAFPSHELINRRLEFLLRDCRSSPSVARLIKDFCDSCRVKCDNRTQFANHVASSVECLTPPLLDLYRMSWELELSYFEHEQPKDKFKLEKSPTRLLENARQLVKNQKWVRAVAELSRVIELAPDSFDSRLMRCQCYMELDNYSCALVDADFCLATDPSNVEVRLVRCEASLACSDFGQAVEDADHLLQTADSLQSKTEVRVRLIRALAALGSCLFDAEEFGNDPDLVNLCTDVLKIDQKHRSVLYLQALLESERGNFRLAENAFKDLVELHPDFKHAKFRYAQCLIESARSEPLQRGISLCQELIPVARDVDLSFVHCLLAEAEMTRENPRSAVSNWSKALSAFPENTLALSRRERVYRQLGDSRLADQDASELSKHIENYWTMWRMNSGGFPIYTISLSP